VSVLLVLLLAAAPAKAKAFSAETPYEREIAAAVVDAARVYPVPPELVKAVISRESAFNPRALSHVGAIGLMQVMPWNAPRLGLTEKELWEPRKNILAGTRLLAALLKHYRGDVISALVGYNARPRRLGERIPRNGETPAYVQAVLRAYRAYLEAGPVQTPAAVPPPTSESRPGPKNRPDPATTLPLSGYNPNIAAAEEARP
jgi:soluble lytic murein transglycosylase-like protein